MPVAVHSSFMIEHFDANPVIPWATEIPAVRLPFCSPSNSLSSPRLRLSAHVLAQFSPVGFWRHVSWQAPHSPRGRRPQRSQLLPYHIHHSSRSVSFSVVLSVFRRVFRHRPDCQFLKPRLDGGIITVWGITTFWGTPMMPSGRRALVFSFNTSPEASLCKTHFVHPTLLPDNNTLDNDSPKWNKGLRALCVLLLRSAAYALQHESGQYAYRGKRPSLPATLASTYRKPSQWSLEIFGQDTDGDTNLKWLLDAQNAEFRIRHKDSAAVRLNHQLLLPSELIFSVPDGQVDTPEDMESLARAIEHRKPWTRGTRDSTRPPHTGGSVSQRGDSAQDPAALAAFAAEELNRCRGNQDLAELVGHWTYIIANGDHEKVGAILGAYSRAADDVRLHQFVRGLYGNLGLELLTRGTGETKFEYACAIFRCSKEMHCHDHLDSVLKRPLTKPPRSPLISLPGYADLMIGLTRMEGTAPENRPKYVMTKIVSDQPLQISCHVSSYRHVLATGNALGLELQKVWFDSGGQLDGEEAFASLKYRSMVHGAVADPVRSGDRRAAGIATSTLICYRDEDGYRCWLHKRAPKRPAEGRDQWHVIPAGGFEPSSFESEEGRTYSVKQNILRECLEEVFGIEEPLEECNAMWYRVHPSEKVQKLEEALKDGKATLHLTGIAVNLLDLRPDICTLLLLHDTEWAQDWFHRRSINWEYKTRSLDAELLAAHPIVAGDAHLLEELRNQLNPGHVVPQGAGAFWLGVDLARQLTQRRIGTKRKKS